MIESNIVTKEINLLLIAVAARSGNTVLSNFLDSHSKIIYFPMEVLKIIFVKWQQYTLYGQCLIY